MEGEEDGREKVEKGGGREEGGVEKERKKGGEGRGHMTHKGMVGTRTDMPKLFLTVRWPSKWSGVLKDRCLATKE